MKYYVILVALLSCGSKLTAQFPDYYVHLVTGTVTISKAGKKATALKQLQHIYKDDVIELKKGAELTLVDKDTNYVILNKAGTYKSADLIKNAVRKTNTGVTAKFMNLVAHEFLAPDEDFEKFRKKNIAGSRGGGTRGDECNNLLFPVNGLKTSGDTIVFNWYSTSTSGYLFTIYNSRGEGIYKQNVKDTVLPVDIATSLTGPGKYLWRVAGNDESCEDEIPVYFYILTPEKEKEEIGVLLPGGGSESLEKRLQEIDKLDANGFIYVALSHFASLVRANPENAALRKSYVLFLLQYGFEKEAKSVWK